jgi:hypothetical protein
MGTTSIGNPEISLKEYIDFRTNSIETSTRLAKDSADAKFEAAQRENVLLKEYIDLRISNVEKATNLAGESMERRLSAMNEFRDALKDQNATFVRRDAFETALAKIEDAIKALQLSKATLEGKASQAQMYIAYAVSFISLLFGLINLLRPLFDVVTTVK